MVRKAVPQLVVSRKNTACTKIEANADMDGSEELTGISPPQSTDANVEQCGRKLSLKDIRRYEKKTLLCPGGCGTDLDLNDIPTHDCMRDLRQKLESAEKKLCDKEEKAKETGVMENTYREQLALQDCKIAQMSTEIKELLLERSRRDEMFNNKETFYKEQITALMDQVAKLERKLQLRRPSNQEDESLSETNGAKEWAYRYDKLLADKITLETLFQRRERESQREIDALKEEAAMLRESLHLEREMLSLEHDHATFNKLAVLTDQLESLVQHKQHRGRHKSSHKAKDLGSETMNGRIRKRVPNSVGSSNSDIVDEEDMEVVSN